MNIDHPPLDLKAMFALFRDQPLTWPEAEVVPGSAIPEPYHRLLVHPHHMTVAMEEYHGQPVHLRVLDRVHDADTYARKILLVLEPSGTVVQFGIVRLRLQYVSDAIRRAIIAGHTPLGRILIQHDVLRWIEPFAYLKIQTDPHLGSYFGFREPTTTYGRLAIIHCDGQPAVDLLEIAAPE